MPQCEVLLHSLALGDATVQNRYGADNVTERDFLRTEGDPGASGYTIKEAVALTRSVVSLDHILYLICRILNIGF